MVARFLLGISDDKARVHVELNKEPKTIDQAVYHAVNYIEATQRANFRDDGSNPQKPVRQTKDHQTSLELNGIMLDIEVARRQLKLPSK